VTPRGGSDAIDGCETLANGRMVMKVRVRAIAEGGEANAAVIRLFADHLKIPKTSIRLTAGATSRIKQLAISGDPVRLANALRAALAG
jgi:uncharacterized protein YggU (UPF0235/DUF167 family)